MENVVYHFLKLTAAITMFNGIISAYENGYWLNHGLPEWLHVVITLSSFPIVMFALYMQRNKNV